MEKIVWNERLETLSREELFETEEKALLRAQLDYVLRRSRFYQEKFKAAGLSALDFGPDLKLRDLSFTEKSELLDDQLRHPPFGSILAAPPENLRRVHRTSGSSGRPVFIALTQKDIDNTMEAGTRAFWCAGVRPGDLIIHCLNYCLWMGGLTDHMNLEHTGATVIPFGVGNSRSLIEMIRHLRPTGISCTPSYIAKLEAVLRDDFGLRPRDLHLKKGLFGGEPGIQNSAFRAVIEDTWGMRVMDANYGMADVLSIFGAECEHRCGLHFHGQGILFLELIDPSTGASLEFQEGQVGEFVCTNLKREGQPLVRFRSHDLAKIVGVGPCACGRNGFRFKILGRSDDMLIVKGINVFPGSIAEIIGKHLTSLTGEFEIVLDAPPPIDKLRIRMECRTALPEQALSDIVRTVRRQFRELLDFSADIELVPEGTIPRTDGKAKRIKKFY